VNDIVDWDALSFIYASEYRKKIIKTLSKTPQTPKEISENVKIRITHVSRTLKELSDRDLVICKTPYRNKGKIYDLTEKGRGFISFLEKKERDHSKIQL